MHRKTKKKSQRTTVYLKKNDKYLNKKIMNNLKTQMKENYI